MNSMRYRAAGVLTAFVLAAAGGVGAQVEWGHAAADDRGTAYTVLGSGEGPASPPASDGTTSGEGPAVALSVDGPTSGEGPAFTS